MLSPYNTSAPQYIAPAAYDDEIENLEKTHSTQCAAPRRTLGMLTTLTPVAGTRGKQHLQAHVKRAAISHRSSKTTATSERALEERSATRVSDTSSTSDAPPQKATLSTARLDHILHGKANSRNLHEFGHAAACRPEWYLGAADTTSVLFDVFTDQVKTFFPESWSDAIIDDAVREAANEGLLHYCHQTTDDRKITHPILITREEVDVFIQVVLTSDNAIWTAYPVPEDWVSATPSSASTAISRTCYENDARKFIKREKKNATAEKAKMLDKQDLQTAIDENHKAQQEERADRHKRNMRSSHPRQASRLSQRTTPTRHSVRVVPKVNALPSRDSLPGVSDLPDL